MGIFDTVFFDDKCWKCEHPITDWQTKSGNCLMREMDAIDLMRQDNLAQIEIHSMCACDEWNSKVIKRDDALDNKHKNTHWNYRLVNRVYPGGKEEIAIYEVYYTDNVPDSCSVDPIFPHGENLEELSADFERYKSALFKPILRYSDFPDCDELEF